jgi:hypothetical protein
MSIIITIGRSPDNDIVLPEGYISGHHAQLIHDDDGKWFIHDLQSANGIFVNGDKVVSPVELNEHDEVLLGGSLLNWKGIYNRYKTPVTPAKSTYRSKRMHYVIGLSAAVVIFGGFFLVNEFFFNSAKAGGNNNKNGSAIDSTGSQNKTINNNDEQNIKRPKPITYDLSCVTYATDSRIDNLANKLDSIETSYINKSPVTVSLEEEIKFGDDSHEELLKGSHVLNNEDSRHLQDILSKLVRQIPNPRGFNYKFFLIGSKEINSWTCGGRIYFTTAMLAFTADEDEIAGILGHEINHNELYHINDMLRAQKIAFEKFGNKTGNAIFSVNKILSSPFGKKDESLCDLHGEDLLIGAGYNPCHVVQLWNRMAGQENEHTAIDNFIRSHPYAATRIECIRNHLKVNYDITCQ